jgi:hypothetical protein
MRERDVAAALATVEWAGSFPMTLRGRIRNGIVVLDEPTTLPEGTIVEVRAVEPTSQPAPATLYERYNSFIAAAEGLPEDLADEHDHYIHGTPTRAESAPPAGESIWEKLLAACSFSWVRRSPPPPRRHPSSVCWTGRRPLGVARTLAPPGGT